MFVTHLVDYNQRVFRSSLIDISAILKNDGVAHLQNRSSFKHLSHESRDTLKLTVACTDPGENGIKHGQRRFFGRNKAPDLRHQRYYADL